MSQHQADAPTIQAIDQSSPLIDLRKRGIADLLARQQEEYDGYPIEKIANGTTPTYQLMLRAAYRAALNASSATREDRPYWPTMWVAVAVALSILLFLKLKFG